MKKLHLLIIPLLIFLFLRLLFIIPFWEDVEHKAQDILFLLRGERPVSGEVIIVEVGNDTFNSLNERWPFPRSYHAHLIENLAKAGAKEIIFDIEFTESSDPVEDSILATTANKYGNVVFSGKIIKDKGSGYERHQILKPISEITNLNIPWGTVNITTDSDGFVRRYELYQKMEDKRYFSIGTLALLRLLKEDQFDIQEDRSYLKFGNKKIPKVTKKTSLINFYGPARTFPMEDYANVIDDEDFELHGLDLDYFNSIKNKFKNKIVLIGLTAEEFHDLQRTPFFSVNHQLTPGVEIHASFIEMVRNNDFINNIAAWKYLLFLLILTYSWYVMVNKIRPTITGIISILLIAGYLVFVYNMFKSQSLLIPVLEIPALIILVYIIGLVVHYIQTLKERRFIKNAFGQYIAPELVEELINDPKKLEYGGSQKEITVLFSDIVSFTPYTESHEPKETVSILQEYLTAMVQIIRDNKGYLDKFVGDEIVAIFGAPVELADHAFWACKAAVEMKQRLQQLQTKWAKEKREPFEIGVGINTGVATVGNLGSEQIFDYTGIGDTINAGARIEALTRDYKTEKNIIVSEATFKLIHTKFKTKYLDDARVKGKTQTIKIYEILGLKNNVD